MNAPFVAARPAKEYDYLIVGAGFAGSVLAERLASQHGARVLLIDRRPHIGGNAYDEANSAGILYHKYGPHIFHTNSEQVVDYQDTRRHRASCPLSAEPLLPNRVICGATIRRTSPGSGARSCSSGCWGLRWQG